MSEVFNNVGLYSKAPPPASPSPKAVDSPLPFQPRSPLPRPHPTAPAVAPVTSAAGVIADGSAWKKKKPVEHSGTSRDTCARADPPFPLPLVLHDMRPSGVPIPNPSHVTHGPIIQKPGNCHRPFNTSNGPSR